MIRPNIRALAFGEGLPIPTPDYIDAPDDRCYVREHLAGLADKIASLLPPL